MTTNNTNNLCIGAIDPGALQTGQSGLCGRTSLSREQRREMRDKAELRQRRLDRDWRPGARSR
jgi:hypothetical protein